MKLLTIAALIALTTAPASQAAYDITADSVYRHVGVLAADSMEGRQVGEAGEQKAADYIVSVFTQAGLEPKGDPDSYFQPFTFIKRVDFGSHNKLAINGHPFDLGPDYQPLEQSGSLSFDFGELVDVGYGIVTDDSSYNDYKGLDVLGKAVLIKRYAPRIEGDTTGADSIYDRHSSLNAKIMTALAHGAKGVFFYTPPTHDDTLMASSETHVNPKDIPVVLIRRGALDRFGIDLASPRIMSATGETDMVRVTDTGYNVVGYLPGRTDTVQIVGAHYDHIGYGGPASRYRGPERRIHNGADDNASGVAALLELARYFSSRRDSLHNSLLFIAFSGEESGTLGSGHYVRNWTVEHSKARLMINMDMIGRLAQQEKGLAVLGTGTCPQFKEYFDRASLGGLKVTFNESGSGPSDHAAFYNDSIPCLMFFTGAHQDYHTPDDDADKIDAPGIVTVADLVAGVVEHFDTYEGPLTFHRTKGDGTGRPSQLSVTLGITPDFISQVKGLGVDGVSPDKPAERAGILKGDVIIKIGDRAVGDIHDYMNALQKYRKGDSCRVELVRGTDTLTVTVDFK
jgi:aminopeptidase YwaD